MMLSATVFCQRSSTETYTMSVKDFDRMIYLAQKGRFADSVVTASVEALEVRRQEIGTKDKVITIQASEIATLQELIKNLEASGAVEKELFFIDKAKMKIKIRKLRRIVVAESGVIVILVCVILL